MSLLIVGASQKRRYIAPQHSQRSFRLHASAPLREKNILVRRRSPDLAAFLTEGLPIYSELETCGLRVCEVRDLRTTRNVLWLGSARAPRVRFPAPSREFCVSTKKHWTGRPTQHARRVRSPATFYCHDLLSRLNLLHNAQHSATPLLPDKFEDEDDDENEDEIFRPEHRNLKPKT